MGSRYKVTTHTTKVLRVLRERDDFMDRAMLFAAVEEITRNQLSAALIHLRKRRAVDVVIQPDGHDWWFALPPEDDTRSFILDERTPESKPRKRSKYVWINEKRYPRCDDGFTIDGHGRQRQCVLPKHHDSPHEFHGKKK